MGEPTPLDFIPELEDEIEKWFYNAYRRIKDLTGFEHHLSITDFVHYFSIYPIPFAKYIVISTIKKIDRKVAKYNNELTKAKNTDSLKNKT